jgi:hypothetical protein
MILAGAVANLEIHLIDSRGVINWNFLSDTPDDCNLSMTCTDDTQPRTPDCSANYSLFDMPKKRCKIRCGS